MSARHITAAIVREAGGPFLLEPAQLRAPKADEVIVELAATGLCHADLLARDQHYPAPSVPLVLGHEGAGVVVDKGAAVSHLNIGDHVVLSFAYCGHCRPCESGGRGYCDHFTDLNFGGADAEGQTALVDADGKPLHDHFFGQSSFATHAVVKAQYAVAVSRDVPLDLLGPMGCGVQTGAGAVLRSLDMAEGKSFAAFGAGAVGLSALLAAQLRNASTTVVVDIVPERLELARELGATHAFDGRDGNVVDRIREVTGGGVDYALDSTGNPDVIEQAINALAKRGSLGLVAAAPGAVAKFEILPMFLRGCTIRGIIEGDSIAEELIPELIAHYQAGRFPFDRLIRFYDFADINQAASDALDGSAIKPVVRIR